jgi:NADPH:quinone reductase
MKAVVVVGSGADAALKIQDVAVPTPGLTDVLVRVRAAGLNRADLRRVQQHYAATGQNIAGLEFAGTVEAIGADVGSIRVGDRVMAMGPNAYAEFATVDHRLAVPIPDRVTWEQAAAIPTWYMTAHNALFTAGRFASGRTVLVAGASSGIGIATVQIARRFGAARILGTSTSADKLERLCGIGLDIGLVVDDGPIGQRVRAKTGDHGADVTVDMVGGGLLGELIDAAALGGHIVSVGRLGGFTDEIDLDKLALKRLGVIGVTFRTLDMEGKKRIREAMLRDLGPALEDGSLVPLVDRSFPLEEAEAAQTYMRTNRHFGKIVLTA